MPARGPGNVAAVARRGHGGPVLSRKPLKDLNPGLIKIVLAGVDAGGGCRGSGMWERGAGRGYRKGIQEWGDAGGGIEK